MLQSQTKNQVWVFHQMERDDVSCFLERRSHMMLEAERNCQVQGSNLLFQNQQEPTPSNQGVLLRRKTGLVSGSIHMYETCIFETFFSVHALKGVIVYAATMAVVSGIM